MSQWLQEVRSAWRALRAAPLTSGAAIAVLALGTGVNLAVFAVAYGVLLRPLPWGEPERLAIVSLETGDGADFGFHADRVEEWRARLRSPESFAAYARGEGTLRGAGEPRLLKIAWATPDLFDVLRPVARSGAAGGRLAAFGEEPGALVLSDRAARRLGGADSLLGRPLTLGSRPVIPVAVLAPGAGFPSDGVDAWIRWEGPPPEASGGTPAGPDQPDTRSFRFLLRLAPGVTPEQAREDAGRAFREIAGPPPVGPRGAPVTMARPTVTPVTEALAGGARPALAAALGAALLVLLVTCGNVAMLLLGRAVVRRRESAVRLALGAGAWRLVRGALAESLLLAAGGALAGLALAAAAALRVFTAAVDGSVAGELVPRAGAVALDAPVLAGAVALVFLVTLLAGTLPALHAARGAGGRPGRAGDLAAVLRAAGPAASGGSGRGARRLLAGLVAAQIAASVVLLAGAALLGRTVVRLMEEDAGFEPERVVAVRLAEPLDDREAAAVLGRVRALPGVGSAGLGSALPPADAPFRIYVRRIAEEVDEGLSMSVVTATSGFLDSLGVRPVAGRLFAEEDERFAAPVVLLSETAARHYFAQASSASSEGPPGASSGPPARSVVGRELPGRLPPIARFGDASPRIVGVVTDVKYTGLDQPAAAALYLPWYAGWGPTAHLAVRSDGPSPQGGADDPLAAAVRRAVREAAPAMPIPSVLTLEQEMARSIGDRRLRAIPALGLAAVALAIALTGVAALFLRAAAERRHEMAVRMALGASGGRVVGMMLRGAAAVTGAGLAAGLAAAALFTTGLRGLLYGVEPHDPATLAVVVLIVAAACLLAAWLPAHRAAEVQPAELLRGD